MASNILSVEVNQWSHCSSAVALWGCRSEVSLEFLRGRFCLQPPVADHLSGASAFPFSHLGLDGIAVGDCLMTSFHLVVLFEQFRAWQPAVVADTATFCRKAPLPARSFIHGSIPLFVKHFGFRREADFCQSLGLGRKASLHSSHNCRMI